MEKHNDWLASMFFQPDMNIQDLADMGVTTENSELKSRDFYKNQGAIKETFTKDGKFDEKSFNAYYDSVERMYNKAAEYELIGNILNQQTYDERDHTAPINGRIRDYSPEIIEFANPLAVSRSAEGVNLLSDPTLSIREAAQKANVFNTETGEFEDYTPNDLNILSFWTAPNLILAKDDNGNIKFNEEGSPYYETLGGRSAVGQDLLHVSDILTTDGSVWNQYDFFDSDSIKKSMTGTVVKTAAGILPYLIPGVNAYVAGFEVARSLIESLPELYKGVVSTIGINSDFTNANELAAYAARLNSSTSDEGQKSLFSFESIGNMAIDSIKQLYAQRAVWKGVQKLIPLNSPEAVQKAKRMSMSYMALTSTSQSFEEFRKAGASDFVAGLGAVGTMLATWGMMNTDYFRDFALGDDLERNVLLPGVKGAAAEFAKIFEDGSKKMTKKKAAEMIKKVYDYVYSKGVVQGALNEGVEEVMEEGVSDLVKGISLGLNYLGLADTHNNYNFGFSAEDFLSRYSTAFFGGAIGGAVFSTHDLVERRLSGKTDDITPSGIADLVYYLRTGQGDKLRKIAKDLHTKGQLGSTSLSYKDPKIEKDGEETRFIYIPATQGESQNDAVYNYLIDRFNTIESLMRRENLLVGDDILQYIRISPDFDTEGLTNDEIKDLAFQMAEGHMEDSLQERLATRVVHDFQKIAENIVATELKMRRLLTPGMDESSDNKTMESKIDSVKQSAEYKHLESTLKDLRQQRDDILSGKKSNYYLEQGLFVGSINFAHAFGIPLTVQHYTKTKYGVHFDSLTDERKKEVEAEYQIYMDKNGKESVFHAFDIFRSLSKSLKPVLEEQGKRFDSFRGYFNNFKLYGAVAAESRQILLESKVQLEKELSDSEDSEKAAIQERLNEVNKLLENYSDDQLNSPLLNVTREVNDEFDEINPNDYTNPLEYFTATIPFLEETESYVNGVKSVDGFIEAGNPRIEQVLRILDILINLKRPDGNSLVDFAENVKLAIQEKRWEAIAQFASDNSDLLTSIDSIYGDVLDKISNIFIHLGSLKQSPALIVIDNIVKQLEKDQLLYNYLVQTLRLAENSVDPNNFTIEDQTTIEALEYIKKLISWAKALSGAAVEGGYNDIINRLNNNSTYASLQADSALELSYDLDALSDKIDYLLNVAEKNRLSKVKGQQDLYYHFGTLAFKQIRDVETEKLQNAFEKAFSGEHESLKSLLTRFNISDNNPTTPEEFNEQFHKICLFESEFRQRIVESYTKEEVVQILASLYGEDALKSYSTKFTTDTKCLESRDMLYYISSVINCDSVSFYKKVYDVVKDKQFTKAPLYSQLYAAKIVYSQIWNPEAISFFNELMETIYSSAEEGQTSAYENFVNSFEGVGQEYLKNRFILSNFTTLIQGAAGTGKTSGVLNLVITLLEDCNYLGIVPSEGQLKGLKDSINTEDVYTKEEFFKKLGLDQIDHDLQSDVSTDRATEEQIDQILKMDSLVEGENKFIIIDEFSLFTSAELELLSKYAKKHGIVVLLAGDFKQNKAYVTRTFTDESGKTITISTPHSTDDAVIFSTPELITSMRAANVAKQMNLIAMQSIMDPVYDTLTVDPTYSVDKINKDLTGKHINLVYTNDSSGTVLAGEKIITPSKDNKNIFAEIDNILKRDVSKTASLCIIAEEDKKDFYENRYQDDPRVTVLPKLNSQGQEFDYVVVDIADAGALFDNLSAYYTAAQRSRLATLIVSEKDSLFTSEHFDRGANEIKTDDQFITRMQEWFLKAFAWTETEETPEYSDWYEDSDPSLSGSGSPTTPESTDDEEDSEGDDEGEDAGKKKLTKRKSTAKPAKKVVKGKGVKKTSSKKVSKKRSKDDTITEMSSDGGTSFGTHSNANKKNLPVKIDEEGIKSVFGIDKSAAIQYVLGSSNFHSSIKKLLSGPDAKFYFGYLYWAVINEELPDNALSNLPYGTSELVKLIKTYRNSGKYVLDTITVGDKIHNVICKTMVDESGKILCTVPITCVTSESVEIVKKNSLLDKLSGWKISSEIIMLDSWTPIENMGQDQYRHGNIQVLNTKKLSTKHKKEPLAKMNSGGGFIYVTEDPYERGGETVLSYDEDQAHTTKLWDAPWHGGLVAVNDVKKLGDFSTRRGATLTPKDIVYSATYLTLLCSKDSEDGDIFSERFLETLTEILHKKDIKTLTIERTNISNKSSIKLSIKVEKDGLTFSFDKKKISYTIGSTSNTGDKCMKFISDILLDRTARNRYSYKVTSGKTKMPFVIPDALVKTIHFKGAVWKHINKLEINKSISADRVKTQGVWNKVTNDSGLSVNAVITTIASPRFVSLKGQDVDPKPIQKPKRTTKKKSSVDPKEKFKTVFTKAGLDFSEFTELQNDGMDGVYMSDDIFVHINDESLIQIPKQIVDDNTWNFIREHYVDLMVYMTSEDDTFEELMDEHNIDADIISVFVDELQKDSNKISCVS